MNPPDLPPPFPSQPSPAPGGSPLPPAPPTKKGLSGCMIALIVVVGLVIIMAVLAAMAIPAFNRVQEMAMKVKNQNDKALKAPAPLTPQQQEDLEVFGHELANALTDKNAARVMELQDAEGLASRVFEKMTSLPNASQMRRGFVNGISKRQGGWMWALMNGELTFLRVRERLGFPAVLMRLKTEEGGVNYLDVLVRPEGTGFKAVDMFNYVFATTTSEESRNVMLAMISKSGSGGLASILGIPQMDEEALANIKAINEATQAGDMTEVLRICDALPPARKKERMFFIFRLQALMALNTSEAAKFEEQYKVALQEAPAILGKDSTTDLLMVDRLFMENDLQGADDSLKRVEAIVGGDPYLKFLRGNARLQMKDHDGAIALANEAEKEDPLMAEVIDLRISVHLARKDHKAVVTELRHLRDKFGAALDRKALSEETIYTEFLTTPEFAAWEKENAKP